jgi:hypothetical protein
VKRSSVAASAVTINIQIERWPIDSTDPEGQQPADAQSRTGCQHRNSDLGVWLDESDPRGRSQHPRPRASTRHANSAWNWSLSFICVMAYLLLTLLHRRAKQKTAFDGSPRRLLAELAEVRCCRLIDMTGRKGRPRVRLQLEEIDVERRTLAETLGAIPALR